MIAGESSQPHESGRHRDAGPQSKFRQLFGCIRVDTAASNVQNRTARSSNGSQNLVTALADAKLDSIPVVAITGRG